MQRALMQTAAAGGARAAFGCTAVPSASSAASSLSARPVPRCAPAANFARRSFATRSTDPSKSLSYASKGLRLFVWGNGADSGFSSLRKNVTGEASQWTGPRPAHTPLLETLWRPKEVESLDGSGFKHVAFGHEHGALVTGSGDVYTFGAGKFGQLGVGKPMGWIATPRKVLGLPGPAVQVAAGQFHTVVLLADGQMWSMGRGQSFFSLSTTSVIGTKDTSDAVSPRLIEVEGNPRIVEIAAGSVHTLARTDDGRLYSWGQGTYGRLGHGHSSGSLTPKLIRGLERQTVVQISCGSSFNVVLDDKGVMYSWSEKSTQRTSEGSKCKPTRCCTVPPFPLFPPPIFAPPPS